MKISFYGIMGLYNFGCEAIVRGGEKYFHSIYPNADIYYYSPRAKEDSEIISDIDVHVVQLNKNYTLFDRCANKVLRTIGSTDRIPDHAFMQVINNSDLVVSIGGDIYTIPAYLRNQDQYPFYNRLVHFGTLAKAHGRKLVIFGASIGPFGDYDKAKAYFFNHLKDVDLILAREQQCIRYINSNGINGNTMLLPDPAFLVYEKCTSETEKKYIGINLSPISIKQTYGSIDEDMYSRLAKIIQVIIEGMDMEIMLLPHVLSPDNVEDNDFIFLNRIRECMDGNFKSKVHMSGNKGFKQIKKDIRQCHIVIAARMHCAINAVCEGIPTIFLSYSDKSKGMAEFIYNSSEYVIPVSDLNSNIVNIIRKMTAEEDYLCNYLKSRIASIRVQALDVSTLDEIKRRIG